MSGLFNIPQTNPQGKTNKTLSCFACGLSKDCEHPRMSPQGGFGKKILIVADPPTEHEDSRGKLWTGSTGRFFSTVLKEYGISLENDCITVPAISCHCEKYTGLNIDCCRKNVLKAINEYHPEVIIICGDAALQSVVGHRWHKRIDNIDTWRGFCIPDQEFNAWVCPIWHPSTVESSKYAEYGVIFRKDISNILDKVSMPVPPEKQPEITYLSNDLSPLYDISGNTVAIDYETTGLKPHAKGHRIVCASVTSIDATYVFPISGLTRKELEPFIWLLTNPKIEKIAHNIKFEHTWSLVRLKTEVIGWGWDTMLAAHVLDNRPGICSLKLQTYLNFGVTGYDDDVAPYLISEDSKNSNAMNSVIRYVEGGGMMTLQKYCALDTYYTFRLAMLQMEDVDACPSNGMPEAYQLLHDGILALCRAEQAGMCIDVDYFEHKKIELTERITKLENEFYESKFYRHWEHYSGKPNINSNTQLANFLYNGKKLEPKKYTANGNPATDEEALEALNVPELNQFLEIKKWKKVRDTYMEGFLREQVDWVLHPVFNLHTVKTFRSSSDSPNFQNIPKRDKEVTKIIRQGLKPRPGHRLMEADFKAIEVSIAACYHKDPVMLDYLIHGKDMHGDMVAQIFNISNFDKHNKYHSHLRSATKNSFVFPQFYGDWYKNNALGLASWCKLPTTGKWKSDVGVQLTENLTIAGHLIASGIKSFDAFVEHMKGIENDFWNNRFRVYGAWKKKWLKEYQHKGEFWNYTGFKFGGAMAKNDVINYPVQSAAFHCLLKTFIALDKYLYSGGYDTRLIGQIHDSLVLDVHPDEEQDVINMISTFVSEKLKVLWPWIIVPMSVEIEMSDIDSSWAEMHEVKI